MNSMLTLEEVKSFLETDQEGIEGFVKKRKLHAYKIGGTYLRFRKEEVLNLRFELAPKKTKETHQMTLVSRISDFWRFNNFYIVSLLLMIALAFLIVQH